MRYSENPVRDAEQEQMRLEGIKRERQSIPCSLCGNPIYRENEEYDGDVYYLLNGETICEDCISDFLRENREVLH